MADWGGSCEPWLGTWSLSKRRDQGPVTDFAGSLLSRFNWCGTKTTKWEQEEVVKLYQAARKGLPWANSSLRLTLVVSSCP